MCTVHTRQVQKCEYYMAVDPAGVNRVWIAAWTCSNMPCKDSGIIDNYALLCPIAKIVVGLDPIRVWAWEPAPKSWHAQRAARHAQVCVASAWNPRPFVLFVVPSPPCMQGPAIGPHPPAGTYFDDREPSGGQAHNMQ